MKNTKVKYSFAEWCKDNDHQDWLDRWDYELNGVGPEDVAFRSNKKFYFKCPRGIHKSETIALSGLCVRKNPFICNQCNSIGQYLIDTFGNDAIEKYWSESNIENPFSIAKMSNKKYFFKCPDCGDVKYSTVCDWVANPFSCKKCGDGNSYPNKYTREFLRQLSQIHKVEILPEHVFSWSENIGNNFIRRIYDFVINANNIIIIEVHGKQHYQHGFCEFDGGRTLADEQSNDEFKKNLAIANGISDKHYIVIDARESDPEWIKDSILNSRLSEIYHFSEDDIDWGKCNEVACKNAVHMVCDLYMSGVTSVMALSRQTGYCKKTIHKYLKLGVVNGWCDYNEDYRYCSVMRPIQCVENGYVFSSRSMCSHVSQSVFGKKLSIGNLSAHLIGARPTCGGFHFTNITKEYFTSVKSNTPDIAFGVLH